MIDVVYPVRPGEDNEPLRYSLRSLANLPHGRVFLVGGCPGFVNRDTVTHLPARHNPQLNKAGNALVNLMAALKCGELSDQFYLFNDDFFVCRPVDRVPMMHLGPMDGFVRSYAPTRSHYWDLMLRVQRYLRDTLGAKRLLSYEPHTPMLMGRDRLLELLARPLADGFVDMAPRTLYGNLDGCAGRQITDVKLYFPAQQPPAGVTYLSTNRRSFDGYPGLWLREQFPDQSPHERHTPSPFGLVPTQEALMARSRLAVYSYSVNGIPTTARLTPQRAAQLGAKLLVPARAPEPEPETEPEPEPALVTSKARYPRNKRR